MATISWVIAMTPAVAPESSIASKPSDSNTRLRCSPMPPVRTRSKGRLNAPTNNLCLSRHAEVERDQSCGPHIPELQRNERQKREPERPQPCRRMVVAEGEPANEGPNQEPEQELREMRRDEQRCLLPIPSRRKDCPIELAESARNSQIDPTVTPRRHASSMASRA